MLSYIRSSLSGKAVSYFLNAEADAEDALTIIKKISQKKPSTRVNLVKRIKEKEKFSPTLAAYSLYYHNGYADFVYSRALAKFAGLNLPHSRYFKEEKCTLADFVVPWLEIFYRYPRYLNKFILRYKLPPTSFSQKEILKATLKMQEINIRTNKETLQAYYEKKPHKKVTKYLLLSSSHSHPQAFLKSAIATQKSAIFWDKIYSKCITLRLSISH